MKFKSWCALFWYGFQYNKLKGYFFGKQAQKDSYLDTNQKFAIYSHVTNSQKFARYAILQLNLIDTMT